VFSDVDQGGIPDRRRIRAGHAFPRSKVGGYYRTAGISYGLQAGAQTFGYAMFFMNERAFQALQQADGFQIGAGPSVVVMDEGEGEVHHVVDAYERRLRVRLRAAGIDGRYRPRGHQDHKARSVI
jgi:hypothetical protein